MLKLTKKQNSLKNTISDHIISMEQSNPIELLNVVKKNLLIVNQVKKRLGSNAQQIIEEIIEELKKKH